MVTFPCPFYGGGGLHKVQFKKKDIPQAVLMFHKIGTHHLPYTLKSKMVRGNPSVDFT